MDNKIFKEENFKFKEIIMELKRNINNMFFFKLFIDFNKSVMYVDLICFKNLSFVFEKIKLNLDVFKKEILNYYNKLKIVNDIFIRNSCKNIVRIYFSGKKIMINIGMNLDRNENYGRKRIFFLMWIMCVCIVERLIYEIRMYEIFLK